MSVDPATATALAAATPDTRDRWIDLLRGCSILAVVLGHWLIAVVVWRDGTVSGFNALEVIPGFWPLTWVLQVMPIFFFVGGFSNLVSLRASRRRGEGYAAFLQGRFTRLMRPTAAFLAPALVVVAVLDAANVADDFVFPVADLITGPLWFLGVYMIVIALAPAMAYLHDRFGIRAALTLMAAAVVVDVLRFGVGWSAMGYANYPVVWLLAHQWGFLYADRVLGPRHGWMLAPLGLALTGALVALGPYPASMVGLATDEFSNMDPPTLPIVTLTLWHLGAVLLLHRPLTRWLQRARVWTVVVGVNAVIMTAFLWHLTVLVAAVGILFPLGFPQPEVGTAAWWLLRPAWLGILLMMLAGCVALLGRVERAGLTRRRRGGPPDPASALLAAAGAVATLWGVLGFAIGGLEQIFSPTGDVLIVLRLNPAQSAIHVAAGMAVMALADTRHRGRVAAAAATVWAALAVAGPLVRGLEMRNVLALEAPVDGLHLVLAATAAVAWLAGRRQPATAAITSSEMSKLA